MDDDLRERAAVWAERTAAEQGLPAKVDNPIVIRRVLQLMGYLDNDANPIERLR